MQILTTNNDEQELIERVRAAGQEHVFRFWDELSDQARKSLLSQLREIDFELMAMLAEKFIQSGKSTTAKGELEPAEFIPLPESPDEQVQASLAREAGEKALTDGRVAAFLVAGGQGTRLGFHGAKGKFPISPVKHKSLFQLHAEKIRALGRKYGAAIPWYIMTSETNHKETVGFFEQESYFGLKTDDVIFFTQQMVPALDPHGKLILAAKDRIFQNPNGHGGSLSALKHRGALEDMRARDIDLIFYFQVDNVLVKMCDPVFLGYHVLQNAEMSAKVCAKSGPGEKVGVLGRVDGKLGVIEYSDLSDDEKNARNEDGSLKFQAGNIAIHAFNVDFVERENRGGLRLPWHVAHKKIAFADPLGKRVEPEAPNGYKFETFVFDALGDAGKTVFLEVRREDEFSPVKNKTGDDSPETARRDMVRQYGRWLQAAGAILPENVDGLNLEISPLKALSAEEFAADAAAIKIVDGLYLE